MTRNKDWCAIKFHRKYGAAPTAYGFIGAFSILVFFSVKDLFSLVLCNFIGGYFLQIEWKLHSLVCQYCFADE